MAEGNKVNIAFGKIISVEDPLKLHRCQVKLNGLTHLLDDDDLPWYYPHYGITKLPIIDDIVCVLYINNQVENGLYTNPIYVDGKKLLNKKGITDDNYVDYLELFYKTVDKKLVKLTYTKEEGIVFQNNEAKQTIELEKITMFFKNTGYVIEDKLIHIGNFDKDFERTFNGETTRDLLEAMITAEKNIYDAMLSMFDGIQLSCVTPFTLPIKTALIPLIQAFKVSLNIENTQLTTDVIEKKTLSETTYISK
jgi:hypothetical protein